MTTLSDNIKKLRENHKLTQDELGDRLGISGKTVSSWENGRSEPKMGMVEKMAHIFGCKKSDIIEEEQGSFDDPDKALLFIFKNPIMMNYGGYDINKMSDEEIIEFANQTVDYMKYAAQKYKK